jgi:hypothetical protein
VTIAKRPYVRAGMEKDVQVIWAKKEEEYFCRGGLDRQHQLDPFQQITLSAQGRLARWIARTDIR